MIRSASALAAGALSTMVTDKAGNRRFTAAAADQPTMPHGDSLDAYTINDLVLLMRRDQGDRMAGGRARDRDLVTHSRVGEYATHVEHGRTRLGPTRDVDGTVT